MPKWSVSKEFSFEAAHSLSHLPETHKCHHLHGHSYKVIVTCSGHLTNQWVIDYADMTKAMEPILAKLDHKNLNDVIGCVTTAENLAYIIFQWLKPSLSPLLQSVQVNETEKTAVIYTESE